MDTDKILAGQFVKNHPIQAAKAIEVNKDDDIVILLEEMDLSLSTKLISHLKPYRGAGCLQLANPQLAKALIEQMDIDAAESILRQCDIPFRTMLLNTIQSKHAKLLSQKLEFRTDSVGAWMTPRVFALSKKVLVTEAIEMVRQEQERVSSTIYIINEQGKLVGSIKLSTLFFADQTKNLAEIMSAEAPKVRGDVPIKSMLNHAVWYEYLSIPVVDKSGKLIGILDVENCKKSNTEVPQDQTREVMETSGALGDLYRIGIRGFLQGLS